MRLIRDKNKSGNVLSGRGVPAFLFRTLIGIDIAGRAEIGFAPSQHRAQHRNEALPHGREAVLHLWRNLRVDLPVKKAVLLQLPELLGQGRLRDALQTAGQLAEALDLIKGHVPENQDLPLSAQDPLKPAHGHTPGHGRLPLKFAAGHRRSPLRQNTP